MLSPRSGECPLRGNESGEEDPRIISCVRGNTTCQLHLPCTVVGRRSIELHAARAPASHPERNLRCAEHRWCSEYADNPRTRLRIRISRDGVLGMIGYIYRHQCHAASRVRSKASARRPGVHACMPLPRAPACGFSGTSRSSKCTSAMGTAGSLDRLCIQWKNASRGTSGLGGHVIGRRTECAGGPSYVRRNFGGTLWHNAIGSARAELGSAARLQPRAGGASSVDAGGAGAFDVRLHRVGRGQTWMGSDAGRR